MEVCNPNDTVVECDDRNVTPLIDSKLPSAVTGSPSCSGAISRESPATLPVRLITGQKRSPTPLASEPGLVPTSGSTVLAARGTVLGMHSGYPDVNEFV